MRFLSLLLLAQVTPLNLNEQPPKRFSCDGGIECHKSGSTLYITGSGASSGGGGVSYDGGKVGEAYMADASITAQVASVAFSADASYLAEIATVAHAAYSADAGYYANRFQTDPTDCAGGEFANAIDVQGNLTCATPPAGGAGSSPLSIVLGTP